VIVLNAADLGFVRNQYIRCKPSCSALNPIIYTYLENYPVAPFAANGSGFGSGATSFPTQDEADAAIASAINRPLGELGGYGISFCPTGSTKCIERIADVAFEWAPAADGSSPRSKFGQLFAYIFNHDASGITETIAVPPGLVGKPIPDFANPNGPFLTINAGDPFPPNLDGLGFKQHPGVCFVCHGGKPTNLVGGVYPRKGKVDGFRLLPLDNRNLMFENAGHEFSLSNQEAQIKKYNQTVLQTVPVLPQRDDDGTIRPAHLAEVIIVISARTSQKAFEHLLSENPPTGGWKHVNASGESTEEDFTRERQLEFAATKEKNTADAESAKYLRIALRLVVLPSSLGFTSFALFGRPGGPGTPVRSRTTCR